MHLSADGLSLKVGMTVFIRIGGEYPKPGRWRCRTMVIEKIKRTGRLRLAAIKGRSGCNRLPKDCFVRANVARGMA